METSGVQVISEEFLKPSSQTPHHLRNLKMSLLDQFAPPTYIPLVFFYQANELNGFNASSDTHRARISQELRRSLSETLTAFYPLAGKLDQENFMVSCNDAGVKYIEARVQARLLDVIQDPSTEKLKQYLPALAADFGDDVILGLQVNFFDCGGIAVGVCLWHYIADVASLLAFMNSWAAVCRGEDKGLKPNFDLSSYFPARDLSVTNTRLAFAAMVQAAGKLVTKRFAFNEENLNALRAAATSSGATVVKDPTRVELVSSFIWKYFIETAKPKKVNTRFTATHVVNLRKRTAPPYYLEHVFGNCIMIPVLTFDHDEGMKGTPPEVKDLVHEFRNELRAVNDEYIRKSQGQDERGYGDKIDKLYGEASKGELELSIFTSWCRFPVYDVDYGWGKPVWVGTTSISLMNCTTLMDTRDGDGIEAWITTLPDNIETLENYFKMNLPSAR